MLPKTGFRRDVGIYEVLQELQACSDSEDRYFSGTFHGKMLRLSRNPLYVFREDWTVLQSIRISSIWITEWRWFNRIIIAVILLSCVALAHPVAYDPASTSKMERDVFYYYNVFAMMIFTSEAVLKVIARGLILGDAPDCCYLREKTNWLDLVAVVVSLVEIFVLSGEETEGGGGFLLVRAFRVVRAIRTIKVFPDLRRLASTLANSGPMLVQWIIFIGLFFCTLAVAGMHMFGTTFWHRCRLTPAPIPGANGEMEWPMDPTDTRFCGGRHSCSTSADGQPTVCGTIVDSKGPLDGITDPWPEIHSNPGTSYGYVGFQKFSTSLLTTLQVSSMDGWTDVLYKHQDGVGDIVSVAFFLVILLLGGLVLLNLAPAILWESFVDLHHNESRDAEPLRTPSDAPIPQDIMSMKIAELVQELSVRKQKLKKILVKEQVNDIAAMGLKPACLWICSRPVFEHFFLFLILLNTVTLAIDSYPPLDPIVMEVCDKINLACSVLFAVEVMTKFGAFGVYFFADHLNVFDFLFVALSFLGTSSLSALRTVRLLRFLRLEVVVRRNVAFRVLLRVVAKAVSPTYSFFIISISYCYCMSLLGLQLFFPKDSSEMPTATTFPRFDSLVWSFTSVFALFSSSNWHRGMVQHALTQQAWLVMTFHLFLLVISRVVLSGLMLGLFAACFSQAREELLHECRNELVFLRAQELEPDDKACADTPPAALPQEHPEEPEPESPLFPKDILDTRPEPSKTASPGMNILRMMRIKQAAAERARADGRVQTFGNHQAGRVGPHAAQVASHRTWGHVVPLPSDAPARALGKHNKEFQKDVKHGAAPPEISSSPRRPGTLEFRRPNIPLLRLDEVVTPTSNCGATGLRQRTYRPSCRSEAGPGREFRQLVQSAREETPRPGELKLGPGRSSPSYPAKPLPCTRLGTCGRPPGSTNPFGRAQEHGCLDSSPQLLWPGPDREEVFSRWSARLEPEAIHGAGPQSPSLGRAKTASMDAQESTAPSAIKAALPSESLELENPENSSCRTRTRQIVSAPAFEPVILSLIVISNICLAFESPYQDPNGGVATLFNVVDFIVVLAFAVEMVLKMMAFGLAWESQGYFRAGWNWIDCITSVTGVVDLVFRMISVEAGSLRLLRSLRVIRVLRPLRLVKRYRGTRILVEAVLNALPTLMNVVIIVLGLYLGMGIVMVNTLKGQLWFCSLDPTGEQRPEISTRSDCEREGGQWVNSPSNFDHLGNAMVTLVHIGTGAGWVDTMLTMVNSVGVDRQPQPSSRPGMTMPVILFVGISRLVLLSLFVGVLIDAYVVAKHELDGVELLSWDERYWVHMQREIFFNPKVMFPRQVPLKGTRFLRQRQVLRRVIESRLFKVLISIVILCCALSACALEPALPDDIKLRWQVVSLVLSYMVTGEVCAKLFVFGSDYAKDPWNIYSLVVAILSDASVTLDLTGLCGNPVARVLRTFRVLRAISIMKEVTFQRMLLTTVERVLPGLANIAALLCLVIFMFACLGVGLFGTISNGEELGENSNFSEFPSAFMVLIRISTGERWHLLLHEVVTDRPGCTPLQQSPEELERDGPQGCGTVLGYPYFLIFSVMVSTILMNLIIAVVLEGFHDVFQELSLKKYLELAEDLAKAWHQRDNPFTGFLPLDDVVPMLMEIPEPLGFANNGCTQRHVLHQMRYLRLYSGRKVHFSDVVSLSARRACLWHQRDYEKNVYQVEFEAEAFKKWHELFADATDIRTVPTPVRDPHNKSNHGTGYGKNIRKARSELRAPRLPTEMLAKETSVEKPGQLQRRQVASAAADCDPEVQLYVGHLIVAVNITDFIARKRAEWKSGKPKRPRSNSSLGSTQMMRHRLQVSIVKANGLRKADWYGSSDAFCRCQVQGQELHYIQSPVVSDTDPVWNFEGELPIYHEGESLEFVVYDDDGGVGQNDLLGRVIVQSSSFYPDGFEGDLDLQETGKTQRVTLTVKVTVGPAEAMHFSPNTSQSLPVHQSRRVRVAQSAWSEKMDPSSVPHPNIICPELAPLSLGQFQELSPLPWPPPLVDAMKAQPAKAEVVL